MTRILSFLVALLLAGAAMATAQETLIPIIQSATENSSGTQITINGMGFGTKAPRVALNGAPLTVSNSSETSVAANLPSGFKPGSYLADGKERDHAFDGDFRRDNWPSWARRSPGSSRTYGPSGIARPPRSAGALPADGRLLPIIGNQLICSVIGTLYGGDGTTNFALPDLRPFAPQGLRYAIDVERTFPSGI